MVYYIVVCSVARWPIVLFLLILTEKCGCDMIGSSRWTKRCTKRSVRKSYREWKRTRCGAHADYTATEDARFLAADSVSHLSVFHWAHRKATIYVNMLIRYKILVNEYVSTCI